MKPSLIIGPVERPYLLRWYLIPRNRRFNIYLHHILRSDDDRALHDHPWWSLSFMLWGSMGELFSVPCEICGDTMHTPFEQHRKLPWLWPVFRPAHGYAHRLIVEPGKSAWTLFLTGPKVREWGFYCPKGWRVWTDYVVPGRKGQIGRGCDDL